MPLTFPLRSFPFAYNIHHRACNSANEISFGKMKTFFLNEGFYWEIL